MAPSRRGICIQRLPVTYLGRSWFLVLLGSTLVANPGCAGIEPGGPATTSPTMDPDAGTITPTDPDGPGREDAGRPRDGGSATRPDDPPPTDAGAGTVETRAARSCFESAFASPPDLGPDYDVFSPTVGSHCLGTDHQEITDVERVVFLGDSITVGTPPALAGDFYRSRLADALAARFGLEAPSLLWKSHNLDGTALVQESGDFASCAKWGARTDDLMRDNSQIEDCFPVSERGKRTLVIMTIGGNDISSITKAGLDGEPVDAIWEETRELVQLLRDAMAWFYEDPTRFPNGVYVVFANMYEFTDGTGDTESCTGASLAGYGGEWEDPDALAEMVIWANEQYMSIAVETGADMIFMLEGFCGHGFHSDDPSAPCYRGPGTERWFDDTCIHPNTRGHQAIADMFMAVVDE